MKPLKAPNTPPVEKLALSIEEAAAVLGIGKTQTYEIIKAKRLPARKFGRRTIILREHAAAFLRSLPASNAA